MCKSRVKGIFVLALMCVLNHAKAQLFLLNKLKMDDLQIVPCSMNNYISVNNVSLEIVDSSDFLISGMLNTTADLSSPLKASVVVKKKVLFEWIRIPCENNMGSCDYTDICAFGYPQDEPCPAHLVQNNIPCRCPFKAGVYILPPISYAISDPPLVLVGKYKASVVLSSKEQELACYNVNFVLKQVPSVFYA